MFSMISERMILQLYEIIKAMLQSTEFKHHIKTEYEVILSSKLNILEDVIIPCS